jgi:amino acid transporter
MNDKTNVRQPSGDEGLIRGVGFVGLTAAIINVIVGGGIFLLPATIAGNMGPSAPIAFLAGAMAIIPVTLCFAAAGSRTALTGGPYAYVDRAFGPLSGFMAGVLMWLGNWASSAGIAAGLVGQAATRIPALADPTTRTVVLVTLYSLLVTLNALGIRAGSRAIVTLATLKLTPLIVLTAIGLFFVDWRFIDLGAFPGLEALGLSMVATIFAYSGMETALTPSGEIKQPERLVPRATLVAVMFVVLLYLGVQTVALGVLGPELTGNAAPIAATAGKLWAPGFDLLLITASVSMLGFLQGNLLGSSRALYALGRDGYLPAALGRITAKHRVPLIALITHATLACALAIVGTFDWLVLLSGGANCLLYVAVCAAAWQMQRRGIHEHGKPFVLPGGPAIPLLGVLGMGLILTTLNGPEWSAMGAVMAVIVAIYAGLQFLRRGRASN